MSTVKAVNFQHPSSSTPAITLDSTGAMTGSFPYPNRNLLYNGAMQVHQRSTSVSSVTSNGYYTADRWFLNNDSMGVWTQSVESDAPFGSGFRKSFKMLCTTADTSPSAADILILQQRLEGQDLQRIAKGTSSAQQLTISFWVKSNITGTYVAGLYDTDNSRMVNASYTINSSATWEKKIIVFPADTTGSFNNDNELSLAVEFQLGAGSNFTSGTLQTSWAAVQQVNRAVGQTNLAAATNNYWQITGVQLETGSVATPFEFKSYGQELRECERYFESIRIFQRHAGPSSVSTAFSYYTFANSVKKRNGSYTLYYSSGPDSLFSARSNTFVFFSPAGGGDWTGVPTIDSRRIESFTITGSPTSGMTGVYGTVWVDNEL